MPPLTPLDTRLEQIAATLTDSLPEKIPDASLKECAAALGVVLAHARQRGGPPVLTAAPWDALTDEELDRRLAEAEARKTAPVLSPGP